jgi:hypothetical protein
VPWRIGGLWLPVCNVLVVSLLMLCVIIVMLRGAGGRCRRSSSEWWTRKRGERSRPEPGCCCAARRGRSARGGRALRGRASLELAVQPFGYQTAATLWGISDPGLAVRVHSIVGGTSAYRHEFVAEDVPRDAGDFGDWVTRTVLNPAIPLFREARYLLAEETGIREPALYNSVLAAIAEGNATRGGIASCVGRKSAELAHPLNVLEDTGLITRQADPFHGRRSVFRIIEPLLTFYEAVMRGTWGQLEQRQAAAVWRHQ